MSGSPHRSKKPGLMILGLLLVVGACDDRPVGPAHSTSVSVLPSTAELQIQDTLRFRAVLTSERGEALPAAGVEWASSDPEIVAIDSTGLARVIEASPTDATPITVTARAAGAAGTARVTVAAARVARVVVTPRDAVLFDGDTVHFHARVLDARGVKLARRVTWGGGVEIDGLGRATSSGIGALTESYFTTVHATVDGAADTVSIQVIQPLGRILSLTTSRILVGRSAPIVVQAIGADDAGATAGRRFSIPIPFEVTSSDTSVVGITADREIVGRKPGVAILSVSANGRRGSTRVEVSASGYSVTPLLPPPGGDYAEAFDLNRGGVVVGNATTAAGDTVAVRWEGGEVRVLGETPLAEGSSLINDRGAVAGYSAYRPAPGERVLAIDEDGDAAGMRGDTAFVRIAGRRVRLPPVPLGEVDLPWVTVTGMNDSGDVTGGIYSSTRYGGPFGVVWRAGAPEVHQGDATAINSRGFAVGSHFTLSQRGIGNVAWMSTPDQRRVEIEGQTQVIYDRARLWDINDAGVVVGTTRSVLPEGSEGAAFLWDADEVVQLTAVVPDGWTILSASGINERGQIVGRGRNDRTGFTGAVLLTP